MSSYPHPTPRKATRPPVQTPAPKGLVELFSSRSKIEIVACIISSARFELHVGEEVVLAKRIVQGVREVRSAKNGVRGERRNRRRDERGNVVVVLDFCFIVEERKVSLGNIEEVAHIEVVTSNQRVIVNLPIDAIDAQRHGRSWEHNNTADCCVCWRSWLIGSSGVYGAASDGGEVKLESCGVFCIEAGES